jgi:kynureninase
MRPVLTGWFAEFDALEDAAGTDVRPRVRYPSGAGAFGGATYDPTSNYRAAAVLAFHQQHALTPERLREISRHQVGLLKQRFESLDIDPSLAHVERIPDDRRGGFLAIRTPRAHDLVRVLRQRGVFIDARADILRLGPAPYLRDDQLRDAVASLCEALAAL